MNKLELSTPDFSGVLLIGKTGSGKTLVMQKLIADLQSQGCHTIYSNSGVTDEMKTAIEHNVAPVSCSPVYLFLDDAEHLDGSFDILHLIRAGRSKRIKVFLAYQSIYKIPQNIINSCFLKVVFTADDETSADFCSLMLGGGLERKPRPFEFEEEAINSIVQPEQLLELPPHQFYVAAHGYPCTGQIYNVAML